MKASIIIPSYNSNERLRLNLLSLNFQDYAKNDVEVIVIDNGSTDNTMQMLRGIKLKFPFSIIHIDENRGIANGRNQGILKAKGDILIFHDSDMIASKDYIAKHLNAHKQANTVVCGLSWKRIYSYYYKKFNNEQLSELEKHMPNKTISKLEDKYRIITDAQIISGLLEEQSFDLDISFIKGLKEIVKEYGKDLSNYYLPWRFFITNNLSVDRKNVIDVGLFDNNIVKYGYEDYDLGIRLYKAGCKFIIAEDIVSIHQEHPQNFNYLDIMENLNYICEKYNNIYFIDMLLVSLSDCLEINIKSINQISKEIKCILEVGDYNFILQLFLEFLQIIRKRIFKPEEENSIEIIPIVAKNMQLLIYQLDELSNKYDARCFVERFSMLLKQIFNLDIDKISDM